MRYVCIHGHFYQPPRENPWLEAIELQDSAYPYHDWNERITAECYAPNGSTRILDGAGNISQIVNNYSKISFNFGPTLMAWAKENAKELHASIVEADKVSKANFSDHGSAMAQAYNHMIMPLANSRDKLTQIRWGIDDFKFRFDRDPEGMWLPETAVDLETLDLLAKNGIKFTILAQYQAHFVRRIGASEWIDVTGGRIDPTRAYLCKTGPHRSIAVFFYDGPISRAVAFEGLLNNGEVFANRLMNVFSTSRTWPELSHIATDGESYGHHHPMGEMALSYALHHLEEREFATVTNYGEFLAKNAPTHEVEIYQNTAWSCAHGVERWNSNCGCNSGGHPGWNQNWRKPLRTALDWLRDHVWPLYEKRIEKYLKNATNARNDYIHVVLNRCPLSRQAFLERNGKRPLKKAEQVEVWKLLEMQRHAMLMYTSCGWFFDELSGIETVQVIEYAGRVVQLASELFEDSQKPAIAYAGRGLPPGAVESDDSIESQFLRLLLQAKSNIPDIRDGAHIYERFVRPAFVDLRKFGAHYAISSVFNPYPDEARIYCYTANREHFRAAEAGRLRMIVGRARLVSEITQEEGLLTFGVLHFGDHNLHGGVREFRNQHEYERLTEEAFEAFSRADVPEVIRAFDRGFGTDTYSLKSLFRDEQRNILNQILTSTLDEAEGVYRQLYERHAPLMRFLRDLRTPLPRAILTTAEYAINSHLKRVFAVEPLDVVRIRSLLEERRAGGVELDATTLEFTLRRTVERIASRLKEQPSSLGDLEHLREAVEVIQLLPFHVSLWAVQNICYEILHHDYLSMKERASAGEESAQRWCTVFRKVAGELQLQVPQ